MTQRGWTWPTAALFAVVVVALAIVPSLAPGFFVERVMTRALMLGVAAATIVFLARYGGMTSLSQILFFGVAGFMYGNAVLETGARGLNLGLPEWQAILFAVAITTALAFLLGAVASRTTGIYFLMLTLVYAVIGFFVFAQVTAISGAGGVTGIARPALLGGRIRLYYAALVLSVLVYLAFRAIGRTAFGIALQGIRDDPIRMAALGFNVPLHRTLAYTLAGFVAGLSGLLNVWFNGQIDPPSVNIAQALILLIIAVVGGISYFEGAWLGALVYVAAQNYLRELPLVDRIGITEARFNTLIGALVLLIMVLSPEGLAGIVARLRSLGPGNRRRPPQSRLFEPADTAGAVDASPATETKGTVL